MSLRTYRVIDTYGNVVVEETSTTAMPRGEPYADWTRYDIIDITDLSEAQKNGVYHGRRRISRLDFLRLFSTTERVAIRTAAKQSGELEDFLDLLGKTEVVGLDDVETVTGLAVMEQYGLIASGRAAEVGNG